MKVLRIVGIGLAVLLLAGLGVYAWASHTASRKLSQKYAVHSVDFPIPFPVSRQEVRNERPAAESVDRRARAEALERGNRGRYERLGGYHRGDRHQPGPRRGRDQRRHHFGSIRTIGSDPPPDYLQTGNNPYHDIHTTPRCMLTSACSAGVGLSWFCFRTS